MKILTKLILALTVILLSGVLVQSADPKLKKNQLSAFPNTYEAPVNSTDVANSNYDVPPMSNSLSETNPKAKIRMSEFLDIFKYSLYKLTRGEAEQIFAFADRNKDDLLDHKEWDEFVALYVFPFEACDKSHNYLIDDKEFQKCFKADPRTKLVEFRRRYVKSGNPTKYIVDVLQTRGISQINFANYLFYRRALYGWSECHSTSKYLSKSSFKCALLNCIPQKYNLKIDYDLYYETGLKIASDRNLIELDFISYLRIAQYAYYFVVFGQPLNTPFIEKVQFIKAIHEDRLPTNFEEKEASDIYDLTYNSKSMDFPTFAFFMHLHKLWNKHTISKPLALSEGELLNLLKDDEAPKDVINAIDNSYTNFSPQEYLEASLILNKKRLNEKAFYSFKQDASVWVNSTNINSTIDANNLDIKANNTNRRVFFSIFLSVGKSFWTKVDFYRAFLISNLYISIKTLPVNHNVGVLLDNLQSFYDSVTPSFNAEQRKNYLIYKALPKDVDVDLLSFLAIENFINKIQATKFNTDTAIEETLLKAILKDNGMENIPDTVIDLAKRGLDSLRRREFIALDVIKYVMIVHSAANDIRRTKENYKNLKLKPNNDPSRGFPIGNRRFLSSPNV